MFITIETLLLDLRLKFGVLFNPLCISLDKGSLHWHSLIHKICKKLVHSHCIRLDLWWETDIKCMWSISEWCYDSFKLIVNLDLFLDLSLLMFLAVVVFIIFFLRFQSFVFFLQECILPYLVRVPKINIPFDNK